MSGNQSRGGDKNEYKRSGGSSNPNSPRNFPGDGGGMGGGGGSGSSGTTIAPPSGTKFPGRGVLYGQMQSPSQLGVPMQSNNLDSDRWQPSPHTPVMHEAERKYEVGKITEEEETKERQLKGILYKLTPRNFENLLDQVKRVNIDNADTLCVFAAQIFVKALMEPTFVEMYAEFCSRLSVELPDFSENDKRITFKRLLINICQMEFERGEREEEEANRTEEEEEGDEIQQTEEKREEKRVKARRCKLGNIRFIGELCKKRMLPQGIMHICIRKLLGDPNEENIEALCKLMSTIGEMIDQPKIKDHMDAYFGTMLRLSNNMDFSSQVRIMLQDTIDLRKNKWQQRRKYKVCKITDEEQTKERQLKVILYKLTPQNFEILLDQVKQVNIDNADTLCVFVEQIFEKALMEPTFVEMYAKFCSRLSVELPDFSENNEKITFKKLLINKCQEEFERGVKEDEEANRIEESGEVKQTEEEWEKKRAKARRRMLGNIRLIGELYKKRMLTEMIMHFCIRKLLGINQTHDPNEENIEALCKLMSTIGELIDHPKVKEEMDVYFDMMFKLSNNMDFSSRVRFMLKDAIDLRKNKWQQRTKVESPKKINKVHKEAAQECQGQANRLAGGPSSKPSTRRAQMDFGPKGSNVLPTVPQMGGYRGLPQQFRAYGNPDPRLGTFGNRPLLRAMGDDTITLRSQGGLARGMSVRGQPSMQDMSLHDMDSRRGVAGPSGYGSISERAGYGQEDLAGRGFGQVPPPLPPELARVSTLPQSGPLNKVMSEERLHDMSIAMIKEFYSARDEKEVALCIRDLNAPSFYPSMICIWVIDSFERKDMDRDSLTKLLINLAKSRDGILSQDSLVRGFESVLSTLEDTVNDAPKAAEFLGRIFAKVLLENIIPYTEVWRLIYEGGEEQGRLVEIGLAAEVLGVILETIKSEKGDPFLNNMRMGSDLRLEDFRPPTIKKTLRLDKFI